MYCIPQGLSLAQRLLVSYCSEVFLSSFKTIATPKKKEKWTQLEHVLARFPQTVCVTFFWCFFLLLVGCHRQLRPRPSPEKCQARTCSGRSLQCTLLPARNGKPVLTRLHHKTSYWAQVWPPSQAHTMVGDMGNSAGPRGWNRVAFTGRAEASSVAPGKARLRGIYSERFQNHEGDVSIWAQNCYSHNPALPKHTVRGTGRGVSNVPNTSSVDAGGLWGEWITKVTRL